MRRNAITTLIGLIVLSMVAAACTSGGGGGGSVSGTPEKGGTFRVEVDEFTWEQGYGFDPTVEYLGDSWAILMGLMLRGLTGYKYTTSANGGDEVIPDAATALGETNADNTVWKYELKKGIYFGDPVNREMRAKDVLTAFKRLGTASLTAGGYDNYYTPFVEGMSDFNKGNTDKISGVVLPDGPEGYTVEFHLNQPVPDWDYRMAMAATAPLPEEATRCFTGYAEYGQYLVASGPYQYEGMDKVDFSDCDTVKKPSGFSLEDHMYLVRNPKYDPDTDNPEARENFPDRFEFRKNTNVTDSYEKMIRGDIDYAWSAPPAEMIRRYATDATLTPYLHKNSDNSTWYLTMTLTEAPFDDINVRKAVNAVMDKAGLIKATGGSYTGIPAEHIVPPSVLGALDVGEYDPYPSADHSGDVDLAKSYMRQSRYDSNGDGVCDAAACKKFIHVTRNTVPFPAISAVVNASLEKIGLVPSRTQEAASFYGAAGTPGRPVGLTSGSGWGPDWPEPLTFFQLTFLGDAISIANNINIPLVGLTAAEAKRLTREYAASGEAGLAGLKVPVPKKPVPSIQSRYDRCAGLEPGSERTQCWADLDKYLMEEIVPWVPYRWSNQVDMTSTNVTKYDFDAFSGNMAFSHVAVKSGS